MKRERWYDIPGVFALVVVVGPVAALCIIVTVWGLW